MLSTPPTPALGHEWEAVSPLMLNYHTPSFLLPKANAQNIILSRESKLQKAKIQTQIKHNKADTKQKTFHLSFQRAARRSVLFSKAE
jgi:hypothetical protein